MQPQKSAVAPADDAAIAESLAKLGRQDAIGDANGSVPPLHDLLLALQAVRVGDFSVRLHGEQTGLVGRIAPWKGQELPMAHAGVARHYYVAHADPARSNANFAWNVIICCAT